MLVSVRDALLAIMTLGDTYGLQLHSEFSTRASHRTTLNVGQVYSTLDRCTAAGLVESAGATDDSLPLSRLTAKGRDHAEAWMSQPLPGDPHWEEMLDQLLITASIAPVRVPFLADAYRRAWTRSVRDDGSLAGAATRALATAAIEWLRGAEPELSATRPHPLATERPRRGRRPARTA